MSEAGAKHTISELGNYTLMTRLGEGGMGAVYKAKRKDTGEIVALKVLFPHLARKNEQFLERFKREAASASKLSHPSIVKATDFGEDKGYHFLAMEYVDGVSLADTIKRRGRIPEKEAIGITLQLAGALIEINNANLVHRDMKPSNILISKDGKTKLTDLGMVKIVDSTVTLTLSNITVGTPHYMSPEQVRGSKGTDIRSDIYSLGATLYHMVTGHVPFDGNSIAEIMYKQIEGELPHPKDEIPELSDEICHVIEKMMAKNAEARHRTPNELLQDLTAIEQGKSPTSAELPRAQSIIRTRLRPRTVTKRKIVEQKKTQLWPIGAAAGAACLLVFLILALGQGPKQSSNKPINTDNASNNNSNIQDEQKASKTFDNAMEHKSNKRWGDASSALSSINSQTSFYKENKEKIKKELDFCTRMNNAENDARNILAQIRLELNHKMHESAKAKLDQLNTDEYLRQTRYVTDERSNIENLLADCERIAKEAANTGTNKEEEAKAIFNEGKKVIDRKGWFLAKGYFERLKTKQEYAKFYKNNQPEIDKAYDFCEEMFKVEQEAPAKFNQAKELATNNPDLAIKLCIELLKGKFLKETWFVSNNQNDIEKLKTDCEKALNDLTNDQLGLKTLLDKVKKHEKDKDWGDALTAYEEIVTKHPSYYEKCKNSINNMIDYCTKMRDSEIIASTKFKDAENCFNKNKYKDAGKIYRELLDDEFLNQTRFVTDKETKKLIDKRLEKCNTFDTKATPLFNGKDTEGWKSRSTDLSVNNGRLSLENASAEKKIWDLIYTGPVSIPKKGYKIRIKGIASASPIVLFLVGETVADRLQIMLNDGDFDVHIKVDEKGVPSIESGAEGKLAAPIGKIFRFTIHGTKKISFERIDLILTDDIQIKPPEKPNTDISLFNGKDTTEWKVTYGKPEAKDGKLIFDKSFETQFFAFYTAKEIPLDGYELILRGISNPIRLSVGIFDRTEGFTSYYNSVTVTLDNQGKEFIMIIKIKDRKPTRVTGGQEDTSSTAGHSTRASLYIAATSKIEFTEIKIRMPESGEKRIPLFDGTSDKGWKGISNTNLGFKDGKFAPTGGVLHPMIGFEWSSEYPTSNYKLRITGKSDVKQIYVSLPLISGAKQFEIQVNKIHDFDITITVDHLCQVSVSGELSIEKTRDKSAEKMFVIYARKPYEIRSVDLITQ